VQMLEACGCDISRDQLARWHRAELIPKPRTKGLGRGAGTATIYPIDAFARAQALHSVLKANRNLADAGWGLWWLGFDVPERYWRPRLQTWVETWDRVLGLFRSLLANDENSDAAGDRAAERFDRLLNHIYETSAVPPVFKKIRHALRKERFKAFLTVMAQMGAGVLTDLSSQPELYDPDRVEIAKTLDVGMGFGNARRNYPDGSDPWLSGDIGEVLAEVSTLIGDGAFGVMFQNTDRAEVEATRDQMRQIFEIGGAMARSTLIAAGFDAFGFARLGQLVAGQTPDFQAGFLLAWLKLRPVFGVRSDRWIEDNSFALRIDQSVRNCGSIALIPTVHTTKLVFPYDESKFL
jgi:hypothetical protein